MICMWCGEPKGLEDWTGVAPSDGKPEFGWHPRCWDVLAPEAVNMNDVVLRVTADGVRARIRIAA